LPLIRPDELLDLGFYAVVLRDVLAARHYRLGERHAPAYLGMTLEQLLERAHSQRDALGVIEAVDAEHELPLGQQPVQLACLRRDG
jgi:hypothetical protein